MIQAVFEAVFLLSVTAYLAYRIGQLVEQRKNRKFLAAHEQQNQKLKELSFDLDYCNRTRRQVQQQLRAFQSRLAEPADTPQVSINLGGKMIVPAKSSQPRDGKKYEV